MNEFDAAAAATVRGDPIPQPVDTAQAARVGMSNGVGTNPDLYAELLKVSQKTGVPISTVEAMPDQVKRQATVEGTDYDSLATISPSTAQALADIPKLMHDDVPGLSAVERVARWLMDNERAPKVDAKPRVVNSAGFSDLVREIRGKYPSLGPDEARAMAGQIVTVNNVDPLIGPATKPKPTIGNILAGALNPAGFRAMDQGASVAAADILGLDPTQAIRKYDLAKSNADASTPAFESKTGKGMYGGLVSLVQNAPGAAAAIMSGSIIPGLAAAGVQVTSEAYGKYRSRGATGGQAALGSLLEGGVEVATELLPMSFMVKKLGKAGAGEFLRGLLGREIPGEQVATFVQDAVDTAIANPDKTWAQFAAERPGAAYETLLATVVQAGAMTGASKVLEHTAMRTQADAYKAGQADENVKALGDLMKFAGASKLRERDSTSFQGFMQSMVQDGPLENLYLNPNELQAAGIDLTKLAELSPTIGPQLEQAIATGQDIVVPTADMATTLPGTPLEQSLLEHLKTEPEGFSKASAATYMKEQGEAVRATVEKVLTEKQGDDTFKASMKAVEQDVLGQLKEANRFTDDVNAPYATMWSSFFGVMAARTGTTPEALYQQYGPKIMARGEGALQQKGDPTETPEFKSWFGDGSTMRTPDGKPMRLYHGTGARFTEFKRSTHGAMGAAVYLGDDREVSEAYKPEKGGRIMEVYARGKYLTNMQWSGYVQKHGWSGAEAAAKADGWSGVHDTMFENAVAVWDPKDIKSAIGNRGTFDPNDPNILHQIGREQALELKTEMQMPTHPEFAAAVANTPAAKLTDEGLLIDVVRYQKPEQEGAQAIRTGVFYLPAGSANAKHYKTGKTGYGGTEKQQRETLLRRPLFVKGATGGKAPEAAYDAIKGKGEMKKLDSAVFGVVNERGWMNKMDDSLFEERVAKFLEEQGGDPALAWEIISNSKQGNTLRYALQEHIIAHAVRDAGYDSVVGYSKGKAGPFISEVFDVREQTYPSNVLNPEIHDAYLQGPRGSFNPETNTISLLKAADLSTFLHESGHFFLEVLADLATQENAPAAIQQDFATFLKWTGVPDAAAWQGMSLDEKRAHHEDFARGFEAYLFSGKAPNVELQGLFQRFRAWLLNVYRDLSALNVSLTPEITSVFDRMLATTDQIKLAEDVRGFDAMFSNKPEGMTEEQWLVYQTQANDATQEAITELESRSLRDMKWLAGAKSRELKKLQAEAKARRDEIERQVTTEVNNLPVYKAAAAIKEERKSDPLDRAAVKAWRELREAEQARLLGIAKTELMAAADAGGLTAIERAQLVSKNKREIANTVERELLAWEKTNPKPKINVPAADLEAVAELYGFTSGDELARALSEAPPARDVIEGMTDQRMLERHGDLIDQRAMEAAANKAVHNEARLRFVATEANALAKAAGKPALLAAAVKQFAADIIARTKVRDLKPGVYAAAEKRAAVDAARGMKANNLQAAAVQKRNQLINGYAVKATLDAQAEIEKAVEYLKKFNRESIYKAMDGDYVEQIHALLERFDLRTGQSLVAIDKRTSLANWLAAQEEAGLEPDIPPELMNEAARTSYKNLTVEELRGLRDTVKQIEHLARLKHKLLTAKDQRDYEAIRDTIVASIVTHAGDKLADNRTRPTTLNAALRMFKGYVLEHRKVASLARELDGFEDGGAMWEYIVRSMNHAGDTEATMRAEAAARLAELVKPIMSGGKRGGSGVFFPALGKSFNREERLGIALNMGNGGNLQRLLDGEGWTLEQVKTVTDTLTATDWKFVQGVWDFLETYRPLIGAKEKRIYGKEPNWVDAQQLTVESADGETLVLRGGYFPIKYDTAQSGRAETLADAEVAKQMMRGAFTSSTTRRSFTKARSEEIKGRPLLYSTDALFNGVNEIIHDLAWHEWLIDANKLLRSKSIDGAIRMHYGAQVMQQFKGAVKDIAAGEFPATHAFERGLGQLRAGTVIAGLGLNIVNTIINVQGITQSMVRIGTKWTAVGIGRFAANPVSLRNEVMEKSPFMANRSQTLNREVNEILSLVRDKTAIRRAADRIMFMPLAITQQIVDLPTWWGAYQKALNAGETDDRAIALADQSVVDAQSGGQIKDLAAIQRGGPFLKVWTTFYGFFSSTYNLSVESAKRTDFKDPLQVVRMATDYLLLWTVPALLGTLLKNVLTGGDWDEEKLAKKVINDQISYLMAMMVGLREISSAVQTAAGVNEYSSMGYSGPAGARFIAEVFKLAQQANQGDVDGSFLKALNNVGGILLRYPSGQINRTVEGTKALMDGETSNPLAIFAGPPPKH